MLHERPSIGAPAEGEIDTADVADEIRFRHVGMTFGSRQALSQIDLTIPSGQTVAVVGHTGSGKTTLVNLIARLFDPSSGTVELGGVDLRPLFSGKAAARYRVRSAGDVPIQCDAGRKHRLGRAASIDGSRCVGQRKSLGSRLTLKAFRTDSIPSIGERGLTLSGGQKQRTAIARAILRNPRILILDDALSSVDTVTEEKILAGLSGVMRNRTTILISHRVSTVQNADWIVVLSQGRVGGDGNARAIAGRGGYYAELYQKQLLEEELEAI